MRDKNHVILDVEACAEEVEEYYNLDDDGWEDEVAIFFLFSSIIRFVNPRSRESGRKMVKMQR